MKPFIRLFLVTFLLFGCSHSPIEENINEPDNSIPGENPDIFTPDDLNVPGTPDDTESTNDSAGADYSCTTDADCVHTCGAKCANADWAAGYEDTCVNIRAYDCSCVNNVCYSDGQAPQ